MEEEKKRANKKNFTFFILYMQLSKKAMGAKGLKGFAH